MVLSSTDRQLITLYIVRADPQAMEGKSKEAEQVSQRAGAMENAKLLVQCFHLIRNLYRLSISAISRGLVTLEPTSGSL
jgi:hypothetical protein